MKQNLSYVLVTPYSIAKSRTGGVIARLLSRSNLELAAAQMITPDEDFTREYAASLRRQDPRNLNSGGDLLANYVEQNLGPSGGRKHRSLLLIFRGEEPCKKLSAVCGSLFPENKTFEAITGETIRDTYADLILDRDDPKKVIYFEPAILSPRNQDLANQNLALFSRYFRNSENIVRNMQYPDNSKIERTLVILKPDNWNYASGRPGTIIDMFSRTGLRIVGIKVFRFSLNQALDFYSAVEEYVTETQALVYGQKARTVLEKGLTVSLSKNAEEVLTRHFGRAYAHEQFYKIVEFMSGRRPETCPAEEADSPGNVKCMILIYEGENAIRKIRDVLGPTDPLLAPEGTVRREFGSNTLINTAHASDSAESYERERKILKVDENPLVSLIDSYLTP